MNGHTPGPWSYDRELIDRLHPVYGHVQDSGIFQIVDIDGKEEVLAEVMERDEAEANALLIAAAPELLAVCKSVVQMDHDFRNAPSYGDTQHYCVGCEEVDCDQDCPVRLAKMAVAKATGSEV